MLNRSFLPLVLLLGFAGCDRRAPASEQENQGVAVTVPPTEQPAIELGPDSGLAPSAGAPPTRSQATGATGSAASSPAESGQQQAPSSSTAPQTSQAPAPTGTAANDILSRAERTYAGMRTMEADFVQEVYVPLLESTQNSRGKMYHRTPDRFLMRFSDPQGDIVVADGRYIWMYYPSTDAKQVVRANLAAGGQQLDLHKEFLSDATSRFNATRTGGETVGGRQTHALTLDPRGASPYRQVRLWIDAQDNLVRRFEITEQNGTVRKLEMRNLRPNVALADDLFTFTPPTGTEVHDF